MMHDPTIQFTSFKNSTTNNNDMAALINLNRRHSVMINQKYNGYDDDADFVVGTFGIDFTTEY